jgi:hypothetical protein
MMRFAKMLVVTVGFGTLGFVMSLVPQKNATGAGAAPVFVTNTSLPVSGTVAAQQSGTWNVGITGTPTVSLASGAAVALPTHLGATPANLITLECTAFSSGTCTSFSKLKPDTTLQAFSLSAGTGLVITDIQMVAIGTAGNFSGLIIGPTSCGGGIFYNAFAVADQSGNISVADHITGGLHFTTLPCFEVPASTETLTLIGYLVQE